VFRVSKANIRLVRSTSRPAPLSSCGARAATAAERGAEQSGVEADARVRATEREADLDPIGLQGVEVQVTLQAFAV